jgi:hypothetical protein
MDYNWKNEEPNAAGINCYFLKYLCKDRWNFKNKLENVKKNMAVVATGNYSVTQKQYIIAIEEEFMSRNQ